MSRPGGSGRRWMPNGSLGPAVESGRGARRPDAPLRVAVVAACPFPERRGTPVRIQRLAEGLLQRGHEVHVVTYGGSGAVAEGLRVHRAGRALGPSSSGPGPSAMKLLRLDPVLMTTLRRLLRQHDIDVVHAHHYEGLLVGLAARSGRWPPLVYDAHTLLETELPTYGRYVPRRAKRGLGAFMDRWLPPRADHVIAVSDTIRDHLLARTSLVDAEVTTISDGVELELFQAAGSRPRESHRPTVVFTGNLAAYQGIDLLLAAFREVLRARPDARLVIVTESSFEPYAARAGALGVADAIDVVVAGFDRVPAALAEADVAVNPRPDCSGIPLKLLNYMAAGKPVVSFRGSAPGVEHGRNGWLAESGDIADFARGILRMLESPELAREIGDSARRHVEAHHSWDALAGAVESVLRGVLARGDTDTGDHADPERGTRPGRPNGRHQRLRGSA